MREIESQLGMWKSWRVHGIDHWTKDHFDGSISSQNRERLLDYKPSKWWSYWRNRQRYAIPSGYYYDGIFGILLFAWVITLLLVYWSGSFWWSNLLIFILLGALVIFSIKLSEVKYKENKS